MFRLILSTSFLVLILVPAAEAATSSREYGLEWRAEFVPKEGVAEVTLEVVQGRSLLRAADFAMDPERYTDVSGDGEVEVDGDRVRWSVPAEGGTLRFEHHVDHRRSSGSYDAKLTNDWALVRLDDLFPAARTTTRKGATSRASVQVTGPKGWSAESPYGAIDESLKAFENPARDFDRPTGWLVAGDLGIRRSEIAGRKVAVAAPVGHGFRRTDMLALLSWTMPTLVAIFPSFPERVLIAGARDEMWRGGLSGPGSLYIQADRPLLSENDTSSLLHELVHVATRLRAVRGDDWIVEGLAEYYSLEVLRRSGTITQRRFGRAIADLGAWSEASDSLSTSQSKGPTTARAVGVMHNLDLEIRKVTGSRWTLDHVARDLVDADSPVSLERLAAAAEERMGKPSRVLAAEAD